MNTTKVIVKPVSGSIGKSVVLNATVQTSSGQKVNGGKLVFKINGLSVSTVRVSNGQATCTYTIPNSTKYTYYTITAVYGGSNNYASSRSTGKLTINKISTTTNIIKKSGTVGTTINLTATVKNKATAANISNGYVLFKINGVSLGKANVTNGVAQIAYKIPNNINNYTVTAIYSGHGLFKTSTINKTLPVNKIATVTSLVTNSGTIGSSVTLTSTVKNKANGANILKGVVVFKSNGITIGKANVTKGIAKISYKIPNSVTRTNYTITAIYSGTGNYKTSNSTEVLEVKPVSTVQTPTNISTTIGKKVTLKTTVKTSTKLVVTKGSVIFWINGKKIGTTTIKNGTATLAYTIPNTYNATGYTITTTYVGTGLYKSSSAKGTLKLSPVSTVQTPTNVSGTIGKKVTLKTTVKTSTGLAVTKGSVIFWINGKKIGTTTIKNGTATLAYTIPSNSSVTTYTVTTTYVGTGLYKSSSGTSKLSTQRSQSVPAGYESYVKTTNNCQVSSSTIQNLAKTIKSLGYTSTYQLGQKIFNYLNDKTGYSYYYDTHKGAVSTWNAKAGNCCDLAHLMIAVSRACNIPSRYCHAKCWFSSGLVTGHVWAELYINGKWYSCDLTSSRNSFGVINNWYKCGSITRYTSLPF